MVTRVVKYVLIFVVVAVTGTYAADYLVYRYRLSSGHALATRKIEPAYAIPQKDGRQEFVFEDPVTVTCVRSLFPHGGYNPCWYVDRTGSKPIPM